MLISPSKGAQVKQDDFVSLSPPKESKVSKYILNLKMNLEYCFFEFAKDAVQNLRHVETLIKMGEWGEVV